MLEDIKDIKGPVYFPADYFLLMVILAAITAVILVFMIRFFLKRKKGRRTEVFSEPQKPAHQIAYEALQALKAKNLPQLGKIKQYYSELSDIARHYLENRFTIRAPEMTTEEFLYSLRDSNDLTGARKNLLKQFLNHCDLVKFAKYGPTQDEIEDSFASAKKLVDETRNQDDV
jgi:hypothetical protein